MQRGALKQPSADPNGASAQEILRILPAASPSAHAPNPLS